jgi:uncharacterized protein
VPEPLRLSKLEARRLQRRAVLLDSAVPNIDATVNHLGFVQMDPINVCGRMHDLILRNRVAGLGEGDLVRHLHGPEGARLEVERRTCFEHHLPGTNVLAAMPVSAWPHLQAAMRRRTQGEGSWSGRLDRRQAELAESILKEIGARGAVCSADIDDDRRDHHGWGPRASLAKTTLHKLFFHGRVLIAGRQGNRRYYDLPERVLPSAALKLAEPTMEENRRWCVLLKLRQRRIVRLSARELPHVDDLVRRLEVDGCPPLYCLKEDVQLLELVETPQEARLLAPLDPVIYDRRLTEKLWQFDYTWEVYTPPSKRVRGYYAMPLLAGLEIVGHVDPKADRANRKLIIANRSIKRGYASVSAGAVKELAGFLRVR